MPEPNAGAREAAILALEILETPIEGMPSIRVLHRQNALRLLTAAFEPIREAAKWRQRSAALTLLKQRAYYADKIVDSFWFDMIRPGPHAQSQADRKGRCLAELAKAVAEQQKHIEELQRRYTRDCDLLDLHIYAPEES